MDEIYWLDADDNGTIIENIKNFSGDVNALTLPVIFKNKIVFSTGTHNGVIYTDSALSQACNFDSLPLFTDHNESVETQIGIVKNPKFSAGACYADLVLFDIDTAKKLLLGAKFGISPRIEYRDHNRTASDVMFKSFSLVLQPADKSTMLNSANPNLPKMDSITPTQENLKAKFISVEEGKKLLALTSLDEIKKKIIELLRLEDYPYPEPAKCDEELQKAREEAEKLRAELNALQQAKVADEIKKLQNEVCTIENELGLPSSDTFPSTIAELNGMKIAYNRIQNFLSTALALDTRKSATYTSKDPKPASTVEKFLQKIQNK